LKIDQDRGNQEVSEANEVVDKGTFVEKEFPVGLEVISIDFDIQSDNLNKYRMIGMR
jgi:hypothetical protein